MRPVSRSVSIRSLRHCRFGNCIDQKGCPMRVFRACRFFLDSCGWLSSSIGALGFQATVYAFHHARAKEQQLEQGSIPKCSPCCFGRWWASITSHAPFLLAQLSRRPDGRVSADVTKGFAEFGRLQGQRFAVLCRVYAELSRKLLNRKANRLG